MKHLIFFFFIITFIFVTCKKDKPPDTLPPITQTGANTFGCKINGIIWVPYFQCIPFTNPCNEMGTVYSHKDSNYFLPIGFGLDAGRKLGNDETFILINNINFGQSYSTSIKGPGNIFDSLFIEYIGPNKTFYSYGYQSGIKNPSNNFTITKLDTVNRIMSGTFGFILNNYPDSVIVTDGRFDFKLEDYCKCTQ